MTMTRISRILLVDDHPTVREGLSARIAIEPDLEVCGQSADAGEALKLVEKESPNLAIVDISLAAGSGINFVSRLTSLKPPVPVLVFSKYTEDIYAERAIRAGASGYVTKSSPTSTIVEAIRKIVAGGVFLSPEYSDRLLTRTLRTGSTGTSPVAQLSDRELEVLNAIGSGAETREIAAQLKLSISTVETYRKRIREKLELRTVTQLTRYATQWVLENG